MLWNQVEWHRRLARRIQSHFLSPSFTTFKWTKHIFQVQTFVRLYLRRWWIENIGLRIFNWMCLLPAIEYVACQDRSLLRAKTKSKQTCLASSSVNCMQRLIHLTSTFSLQLNYTNVTFKLFRSRGHNFHHRFIENMKLSWTQMRAEPTFRPGLSPRLSLLRLDATNKGHWPLRESSSVRMERPCSSPLMPFCSRSVISFCFVLQLWD